MFVSASISSMHCRTWCSWRNAWRLSWLLRTQHKCSTLCIGACLQLDGTSASAAGKLCGFSLLCIRCTHTFHLQGYTASTRSSRPRSPPLCGAWFLLGIPSSTSFSDIAGNRCIRIRFATRIDGTTVSLHALVRSGSAFSTCRTSYNAFAVARALALFGPRGGPWHKQNMRPNGQVGHTWRTPRLGASDSHQIRQLGTC